VTNVGVDRSQLSSMAKQARSAMGSKELTAVADRGYFKGEEILACEQAGIIVIVPKPLTSGSKAEGRFGKQDFIYETDVNEYRCPAGQRLIWRFTSVEHGMTLHSYWSSACQVCALHDQCTTGKERRVKRWEHEAVLEAMQHRLDNAPEMMRVRRQTVEHPFGTIKSWMGATHFLTRTLERVSTEMSLHVLAYNVKRVMKLLGIGGFIDAIRACALYLCSGRAYFSARVYISEDVFRKSNRWTRIRPIACTVRVTATIIRHRDIMARCLKPSTFLHNLGQFRSVTVTFNFRDELS
jgi:transposase